ncbi:flavodoxin domain-containing protein [Patulibacter brassicae]|uniref:Flavodoxin domain-containing protein n=1 Tax=Patulibacter brassicae TaxID=1705717 RepID=A0ABU4VK63_9ACTN|nr:flavodoxin domain-containing protein [Patulibacter brassicae]MDX8151860.1 flavodoxin domain-containing protein [Patulibacter brassicae]
MPTAPCLIVVASRHGHTRRIAEHVAGVLERTGLRSEIVAVADAHAPSLADRALVIAGGSVHAGHHDRLLVRWLRTHAGDLERVPLGVFSASLSAGDRGGPGAEQAEALLRALLEDAGVHPARSTTVAGALQYRAYGRLTRWTMRRIARRKGLPTDPRRDVELTDWAAMDAFATGLADLALAVRPARDVDEAAPEPSPAA